MDQQTISLQTWSSNTLRSFCRADGKGLHYSVEASGVWADCTRQKRPVIHNAIAELPHRKGMPAGHAEVIRELVVPIFRGEQIVAAFGVGNKEQNYDQRDIELVSMLGDMAWDIVLRKRSEATLRESEAKYRSVAALMRLLCDNVPDMIWAKDLEKRYIFANTAICRNLLNAADTDEPIGKLDMFFAKRERTRHADNPKWHTFGEICRDTDAITLDAGTPQQFDEYGNVQGKFLFLDVHKAPLMDENGKMIGIVGSARDVTTAKEIEQKLKESEERFRTLADCAPVGIYLTDPDGDSTYVNRRWCEAADQTPEEAHGKGWMNGLHADDRATIGTKWYRSVQSGGTWGFEYRFRKRDGRITWVYGTAAALCAANGTVTGYVGTNIDISTRKQAEAEKAALEARNRQLQKAESLGRMAGAIAHHFNNQLQAVMGNLEMAMDDLPLGVSPVESLLSAMQAARKAAEVSGLMLTYLGQTPGRHEPMDLTEVCRRAGFSEAGALEKRRRKFQP